MSRDRLLLYAAAFSRASAVGMSGVLLAVYVAERGFGAWMLGALVSAGLLGAALGTLLAVPASERFGRRATLIALAALGGAGTALFATARTPALLLATAFLGMLNGMGRDRGAAYSVEQSLLPEATTPRGRTRTFVWYTVVLDSGHALGALGAGAPVLLRGAFGFGASDSYSASFGIVALLTVAGALAYGGLSTRIVQAPRPEGAPVSVSPDSRRRIVRLSGLFALDSVGGGFLTTAVISYWFLRRFAVGEETLAPLILAARVANGVSSLGAAWLADRIGLVRTMVFTHLPSSLLLLLVPAVPSFALAAILFLLRECLVQMDVPARQSYVVAVVQPAERLAATGATNVVRTLGWAAAPVCAGAVMQSVGLGAPLVIGASLKMAYDVLLYRAFRGVKPPEEEEGRGGV